MSRVSRYAVERYVPTSQKRNSIGFILGLAITIALTLPDNEQQN
jgi:hypothetical protein